MYPEDEHYSDLAADAFRQALVDVDMLLPTSQGPTPLFAPNLFNVQLGGDAGMVGSLRSITLPLQQTFITIGRPYGIERGYVGDTYTDADIWMPFSVWTMTNATQDDVEQRLLFARDKRQNVFSKFHLSIQVTGVTGAKPRPESPITGLAVVDYRWRFFHHRT